MHRLLLALLLALVVGVAACGDGEETAGTENAGSETTATEPASPGETAEAEGCRPAEQPEPREPEERRAPRERLERGKTYTAVFTTSCGEFSVQLAAGRAPKTAASFAALARDGFFDGLTFHRIVPGFVIQGGDPAGTGEGGPGYDVVEAPPSDLKYERGVVAMAKTELDDPGTSGSQFFVVTAEDAGLPADYALLGRVTEGLETVQRIEAVPTDPNTQTPNDPVVIEKVEIRES